jgi:hypothetical protein
VDKAIPITFKNQRTANDFYQPCHGGLVGFHLLSRERFSRLAQARKG